jgi:hypothetical protein
VGRAIAKCFVTGEVRHMKSVEEWGGFDVSEIADKQDRLGRIV